MGYNCAKKKMKKLSIITTVVLLFMAFCFSSCRKDNNSYSGSGNGSSSYNSNSGSGGSSSGGNSGGYNGGSSGGSNGGSSGGSSNTDVTPSAPTGVKAEDCGPRMYPYALVSWNYDWSVDRWDVYRSTSASGSFTKKGSNVSNSWADESVSCGNTYYYKVKAVKGSKESAFSSVTSVYIRN